MPTLRELYSKYDVVGTQAPPTTPGHVGATATTTTYERAQVQLLADLIIASLSTTDEVDYDQYKTFKMLESFPEVCGHGKLGVAISTVVCHVIDHVTCIAGGLKGCLCTTEELETYHEKENGKHSNVFYKFSIVSHPLHLSFLPSF